MPSLFADLDRMAGHACVSYDGNSVVPTPALGFPSGVLLPALTDHIAVRGVDLHEERLPTEPLRRDQGRARPGEEVEDVFTSTRGVVHRPLRELYWLLREVDHFGRRDLLDAPDVGGVRDVGVEVVGRAFLPAVEAPLMISHEVFSREHRPFLHPDHGLGEVEPRGLE